MKTKPVAGRIKEHRFTIVVKTHTTRKNAEFALLSAFAKRDPDNCEFHIRKTKPSLLLEWK
jgi:hypothetical protein